MSEKMPGPRKFEELPEKKLAREIVAAIDALVADVPEDSQEEGGNDSEIPSVNKEFELADGRRVIVAREHPELNDDLHEDTVVPEELVALVYIIESEHWPQKRSVHMYYIARDNTVEHVFNPPGASGGNDIHDILAQARSEIAQREMGLTKVGAQELQGLLQLLKNLH